MTLPSDTSRTLLIESDINTVPPSRPRAPVSLVVLATLAVGYTLWAAQAIVLPIMLAAFFALIGNPILRGLRRLYVPRFLGALLVLCLGVTGILALGVQLAAPAMEWAQQAPQHLRYITREMRDFTKPMQQVNQAAENFMRAADVDGANRIQIVRTRLDDPYKTITHTPKLAASILAVVLLTFFFMVYGENLQRHVIALLPNRQKKRFTTDIMRDIEREVSRYVLTISIINCLVGLVFGGILYVLHLPLPETLLWGTVVALLNFAPYIGPLICAMLMLLMGLVEFGNTLQALLPTMLYLMLHTIEGQIITPIVLGRRMAISPLMLILALMLFGWLWAIVGLLLAVPLLVCVKMVLSRIDGMQRWARLFE